MVTTDSDKHFDFARWSTLASEDPERFEAERAEVIANLIDQAPDSTKRRMVGLQWQIDRMREQAPNPMAACVKMSKMMWDSVLGKGGLLETLDRLQGVDPRSLESGPTTTTAAVLPFRARIERGGETDPSPPGDDDRGS